MTRESAKLQMVAGQQDRSRRWDVVEPRTVGRRRRPGRRGDDGVDHGVDVHADSMAVTGRSTYFAYQEVGDPPASGEQLSPARRVASAAAGSPAASYDVAA